MDLLIIGIMAASVILVVVHHALIALDADSE